VFYNQMMLRCPHGIDESPTPRQTACSTPAGFNNFREGEVNVHMMMLQHGLIVHIGHGLAKGSKLSSAYRRVERRRHG
jgi:hypothetical protein